MKKIIKLFDNHGLKIGISFLILFTALYPKLPSVHIIRTWVYIRLEDFFILAVFIFWLIQLIRRKVKIFFPVSIPIFIFWFIGLLSLIYSVIFIAPSLSNFFPHVAFLNYARRIEYMVLFFVAISTVRSVKDVKHYIIILSTTSVFISLYALGQKFYLHLWSWFPDFFQKYSFCFPSFQTGNEEFAKGIPLCLPDGARITSTFGGHYDLAAYLVIIVPIFLSLSLSLKNLRLRLIMLVLFLVNLSILILTASRVSFMAYLLGSLFTLIFLKQKKYIIPLIIISAILLLTFSESTAKRLLATVRLSSIVTNSQGQLVGEAPINLPQELKNKIEKDKLVIEKPAPIQNLPQGSGYIGLPQAATPVATSVAVVKKTISPEEARRLKLADGSLQLSTVSGSFTIRKALVYDISFTTRFQAEWPNAWNAFLRNPALGSGYSSITLATDNDYFRALGETGFLGLISFLFIFLIFGITLKELSSSILDKLIKAFAFGLSGGVIGLMLNASLIDVFEASKVAENLWMLLGIGVGGVLIYQKKRINYLLSLKKVLSSKIFLFIYLLVFTLITYLGSVGNFFTGNDFSILKIGATLNFSEFIKLFTNYNNLPNGPLFEAALYIFYTLFSFQPHGYHVMAMLLHVFTGFGLYLVSLKFFKSRLLAFLSALIFLLNPLSSKNVFYFSAYAPALSAFFIIYSLNFFINFKKGRKIIYYLLSVIFAYLAFLTHYTWIILPISIIFYIFKNSPKLLKPSSWTVPFLLLFVIYLHSAYISTQKLSLSYMDITYLLSILLAPIFISLLLLLSKLLNIKKTTNQKYLVLIFCLLLYVTFVSNTNSQNQDWQRSGNITKNTLTDLRVKYETFNPQDKLVFINVPRKNNEKEVFSSGLEDAVWFIYQKESPQIIEVDSLENYKKLNLSGVVKAIMVSPKDGTLKEVNL